LTSRIYGVPGIDEEPFINLKNLNVNIKYTTPWLKGSANSGMSLETMTCARYYYTNVPEARLTRPSK